MRNWIDLFEGSVEIAELDNCNVRVWKNPNAAQMANLFSSYTELRGLMDSEGDFYVWNAWSAIHNQIADALGLIGSDNLTMKNGVVGSADDDTVENANFLRAFGGKCPTILDQ